MKEIKKISIIGMGALGLMYGNLILDQNQGDQVTYIVDKERMERYKKQCITVNGEEKKLNMVCFEDAESADLLIVAVKVTGLASAIDMMKTSIGPDTVIVSVLNGIESERLIGERYGYSNVIYSVVQGMDAMKIGSAFTVTHTGEFRIGCTKDTNPEAYAALKSFFDRVQLAYSEDEDIIKRLWGKFMLNVGINQVCMAYGISFGQALEEGEPNRTLIAAFREVIALANAAGIGLSEADLNSYIEVIKKLNYDGIPSMAQDRVNKKYSEVESFAGTVIRLAKEYGLYVPTNQFLYQKVKEIESAY